MSPENLRLKYDQGMESLQLSGGFGLGAGKKGCECGIEPEYLGGLGNSGLGSSVASGKLLNSESLGIPECGI